MRRIKEKIKAGQTKEITKPESAGEAEPRSAKVIDLAALLRESLNKGGGSRRAAASQATAKTRATGRPPLRVVSSRGNETKAPAKRKRA
jgi:DNA end-binding protein Ku